jgi:DNA-binding response OmpR family regulator
MRALIIEDEALIAHAIGQTLEQAGFQIAATCPSIARALTVLAAEEKIDFSLLDASLRGASSEPVAAELMRRGIPFIFISGTPADVGRPWLASAPLLLKPFSPEILLRKIRELMKTPR